MGTGHEARTITNHAGANMDRWTIEVKRWATDAAILADQYEKEATELEKGNVRAALAALTAPLEALRAALDRDAK